MDDIKYQDWINSLLKFSLILLLVIVFGKFCFNLRKTACLKSLWRLFQMFILKKNQVLRFETELNLSSISSGK